MVVNYYKVRYWTWKCWRGLRARIEVRLCGMGILMPMTRSGWETDGWKWPSDERSGVPE